MFVGQFGHEYGLNGLYVGVPTVISAGGTEEVVEIELSDEEKANLKVSTDDAIMVKDPEEFGLPRSGINENYIFAKEDFYFVYPTNYNRYVNQYRDTFQHGGVTMEECLLPVVTLRPKG